MRILAVLHSNCAGSIAFSGRGTFLRAEHLNQVCSYVRKCKKCDYNADSRGFAPALRRQCGVLRAWNISPCGTSESSLQLCSQVQKNVIIMRVLAVQHLRCASGIAFSGRGTFLRAEHPNQVCGYVLKCKKCDYDADSRGFALKLRRQCGVLRAWNISPSQPKFWRQKSAPPSKIAYANKICGCKQKFCNHKIKFAKSNIKFANAS
jgi:hypothetical protein